MITLFVLVIIGIACFQKYAPPAVSGSISVIVIIYFAYQWISLRKKRKV